MKRALVAIAATLLIALAGYGSQSFAPILKDQGKPVDLDAHEDHAAVSMFGQMRTSVSSWLWLKADLYLHNGVEMRPLTDGERLHGKSAQTAKSDGHEALDSTPEVTVVPAASEDFRGWMGDVERATSAYKDMAGHGHNDPLAAMPLYRLMTWIDPNFAPGWTTGAMILARDRTARGTKTALSFLDEGLAQNPRNVQILCQEGYLRLVRQRDYAAAQIYFETVRQLGKVNSRLLEDEEDADAIDQSYRWLDLIYRDTNQPKLRADVVEEGLKLFSNDGVLQRSQAQMRVGRPGIATRS